MNTTTLPHQDRDLDNDRSHDNDHDRTIAPTRLDCDLEISPSDRDLIAILDSAKPYPAETDREAKYMSAYRIARTIREHEGTLEDEVAELDSRWDLAVYHWSACNGFDGEEIAEILYGLWPESVGADRSPFHRALQAWCQDPEVVTVGISPTANRAAAFCYHLQRAVGRGAFYLSCRTLGVILKVSHTRAADILKALWSRSVIRLVAEADFAKRMARQWVFGCEDVQGFTHGLKNSRSHEHNNPLDFCPADPGPDNNQVSPRAYKITPVPHGIESATGSVVQGGIDQVENGGGGSATPLEDEDRETIEPNQEHAEMDAAINAALQEAHTEEQPHRFQQPVRREPSSPTGIGSILSKMASCVAPGEEIPASEGVQHDHKKPSQQGASQDWDPIKGMRPEWRLSQRTQAVVKRCKDRDLSKDETRRHLARLMLSAMGCKETPIAIDRVLRVYKIVRSWGAIAKAAISLATEPSDDHRMKFLEYRARAQAGMTGN